MYTVQIKEYTMLYEMVTSEMEVYSCVFLCVVCKKSCRYIQRVSKRRTRIIFMAWTINGASTHARQLVAVFQVLCSLYGLPCVGYAQNSLQFVSRSPLIHVVGRSFCLYTDSLFAQIGDTNDKCSSSLGGWMLKRRWNSRCTAVADSVLTF